MKTVSLHIRIAALALMAAATAASHAATWTISGFDGAPVAVLYNGVASTTSAGKITATNGQSTATFFCVSVNGCASSGTVDFTSSTTPTSTDFNREVDLRHLWLYAVDGVFNNYANANIGIAFKEVALETAGRNYQVHPPIPGYPSDPGIFSLVNLNTSIDSPDALLDILYGMTERDGVDKLYANVGTSSLGSARYLSAVPAVLQAVPEPASGVLAISGLAALVVYGRRKALGSCQTK